MAEIRLHRSHRVFNRRCPWRLWLFWFLLIPDIGALAQEIPDAAGFCLGGRAETTPSVDFSLQENGAVIRHAPTGFEWQRCALGQKWTGRICEGEPLHLDWRKAQRFIQALSGGWRLPTLEELTGIVERCRPAPAVNQQAFPNTRAALYWTSTEDLAGIDRAWSLSLFSGGPYRTSKRQGIRVRLVREPPAAAPPAEAPPAETPSVTPPAPPAEAPAAPPAEAPPAPPAEAPPAPPAETPSVTPPAPPAEAPAAPPAQ